MAGAEIPIPTLPLDRAADTILQVNPTLGAVIIFEAAAILALAWFITRLVKMLVDAKTLHTADLKLSIEATRDLREAIMAELQSRRGGR